MTHSRKPKSRRSNNLLIGGGAVCNSVEQTFFLSASAHGTPGADSGRRVRHRRGRQECLPHYLLIETPNMPKPPALPAVFVDARHHPANPARLTRALPVPIVFRPVIAIATAGPLTQSARRDKNCNYYRSTTPEREHESF